MVPALEPNRERMRAAALQGYATATDLADYLVKQGVPFRDAHEVVGKAVAFGIEQGKDLAECRWPNCGSSATSSRTTCSRC